jgi:formate hydrogenlyase subunit 3/multisubunit Na+/H+ antiporter MnhD subunit
MAAWALLGSLFLYAGVVSLGACGVFTLSALSTVPSASAVLVLFLVAFGIKVPL